MVEKCLIEVSSHLSYVHEIGRVDPDLLVDRENIVVTEEQADALVAASKGVIYCDDCFPEEYR